MKFSSYVTFIISKQCLEMLLKKERFGLYHCLRKACFIFRGKHLLEVNINGAVAFWRHFSHPVTRGLCSLPRQSMLLFPGQGSQYVGMCSGLLHNARVTKLFKQARSILGYDVLKMCLSGPENMLNKTEFCQPAVFLSSLAALECLAETRPEFSMYDNSGPSPNLTAAAGFSIGEFAALVFGRAITFNDALHVIQVRAQAMQRASDAIPSGMVSLTGLGHKQIEWLCDVAKKQTKGDCEGQHPVAVISSHLFSKGFVVAGVEEVIQFIEKNAVTEFDATRIQRLPVAGAFHSPIMKPAQPALRNALDHVKVKLPQIPVYSNVTAQPYNSAEEIRSLLVHQLVKPVRWHQTILNMFGTTDTITSYEIGPQRQLKSMMSHINRRILKNFVSVEA